MRSFFMPTLFNPIQVNCKSILTMPLLDLAYSLILRIEHALLPH